MPRFNPDDPKSPTPRVPVPVDIEAVYQQILESLATSSQNSEGFRVLHVESSQISADEHYQSIKEMARAVGLRVTRLHDGVSCADKARAMKTPTGILLTTPEALEAFVVIRAQQLPSLFGQLEYLIVEESNAVVEPGQTLKLQSTLSRIDLATKSSPRRIALSP
ncbi:DEAD/DEAH box helicase [Candidatus Bipolaricaulota bacterium]